MLNDSINQLMGLTKLLNSQIENQMNIFNVSINEALKNVSDGDATKIEHIKANASKIIELAKQGKADEAQNLITQLQNECKNNK